MLANAIFHHIGVAVEFIERTAILFTEAGYKMSNVIFDPKQCVNIAFLSNPWMVNSPLLELVEPVDENSPVRNILNKVGVSTYYFCYKVEN